MFVMLVWTRHESEAKSSFQIMGESRVVPPRYCQEEARRQLLEILNQLAEIKYRLVSVTQQHQGHADVTVYYLQN